MTERYLRELDRALGEAGVSGRLRRRIVAEIDDHFRSDPTSVERFEPPAELAQRFVDDLALVGSRRAAYGAVAALAPLGIGLAAVFGLVGRAGGWSDLFGGDHVFLDVPAAFMLAVAPQVSFVAGMLGLLGAVRRASPRLVIRRAYVALGAGAATALALGIWSFDSRSMLASWWTASALAVALASLLLVTAQATTTIGVARLRMASVGPGDVFDDLGPIGPHIPFVRRSPWRLCLVVGLAVALAALAGGIVGGQPDEGVRNAVGEVLAVFGGFALLGRYLGLRR